MISVQLFVAKGGVLMLGQVHDHIVKELGESSRTDTIFVLTAIIFNLIVLGINFGVASEAALGDSDATYDIILAIFIVMTALLNLVAMVALVVGRRNASRTVGRLGRDVPRQ